MLLSKLILYSTYQERNINGILYLFKIWIMREYFQVYYLVNWRNGKYVQVWKSCQISQKAINKNAMHLESLLELLEGDNECIILANQILGETMYFHITRNIIAGLI